jgi:hypothetical protein
VFPVGYELNVYMLCDLKKIYISGQKSQIGLDTKTY